MPDPSAAPIDDRSPAAYTVIARDVEHEIEIKRSRFRCVLRRAPDEAAARAVVAQVRAEHRLARHHCSAFLVGPHREVQRSSDDGEPSGTAGVPMLDAMRLHSYPGPGGADQADLSDVVAVVVRWFGGVLLGAGGLVRAYSEVVSQSLDAAGARRRERMRILGVDAPHADAGRWENELRAAGVGVLEAEYGANVVLRLAVPDLEAERSAVAARVAAVTAGSAVPRALGTTWVDGPVVPKP
ncbi:DUF1949 domain-containing protein [Pseudoclavibacter chungangensis]|uniref:DUF1949 domain-containing protein n=1 Tax=Pseudoclavibacter chungangensis TaxID=587635 RepID=A0A7J5BW78_9MICO|nr:YigZ family protein [Pseudoclavibacter chungangensis]KAB1657800.1 DUF1949 domain-containing protein [Pseudoclavibacter chungangensis]NYJ66610.1 putative YigZ family protein [Pseudoclavibacter chungangensis]